MTSLLVIIVLVLLAVALWQLTKIFDLTQVGSSSDDSQIASDNDNNVQGYIMFGFLAFIYIFTIYGLLKWGNLALHTPASEHGILVDSLMNITWVLIFTVQVITQGLLYWFSFKYKGNKNKKALFFADSNKLEAIWSIIPSVVLACLILYGLYAWNNIMFVDKDEEVVEIELYAQQFKWTARYAGSDNVLGKANVRLIEGINTLGVDMSDPNAQDDIIVSELHIPKGKKIHFKMRSQDVLHSAYFPHFRAQMNCVPGMVTEFAFVPTYTTEEYRELPFMVEKVSNINKIRAAKSIELVAKGDVALDPYTFDYLLLCNKICGASHYNMQMKVIVDSPADYKKWLSEKTSLAQDIKAAAATEKPVEEIKTVTDTAVKVVVDTVEAVVAKIAMK